MKQNRNNKTNKTVSGKKNARPEVTKGRVAFSKKRILICIAAIVLAVAAFLGIMLSVNAYRNSGAGIRDIVILKSENFELTVPMFSYYVRAMGVEKEDYMAHTEQLMKKMTVYEVALEDGTAFDEQVKEQVDRKMQMISYDAEKEKMDLDEYLSLTYGRGVKASDIRSFEEMLTVSRLKGETLLKDIGASEEELAEYCKENSDDYLFCDFNAAIFEVPFTEKMTTAEKEALVNEYEEYANEIAASKSEEELFERFVVCLNKIQEATEQQALGEEDIEGIISRSKWERYSYKESLSSKFEIDAWLFSTDRQAGDSKVKKGGSLDGKVTFGIYYMTRPLYTNDDPTYTIYDILVPFSVYTETAAESNVKRVADEYRVAPTEHTLNSFAAQYMGGLSENYICGDFTEKELKDWLAADRKKGDTLTYKAKDGWHFICFESQGLPECYAQAKLVLDAKAEEDAMATYAKKHPVAMDTAGFKEIPDLTYGWFFV